MRDTCQELAAAEDFRERLQQLDIEHMGKQMDQGLLSLRGIAMRFSCADGRRHIATELIAGC